MIIAVKQGSRAARLRVQPGDMVVSIDDDAIDIVRTLRQCAADWRGRWTIKTQRGSRVLVATVTG